MTTLLPLRITHEDAVRANLDWGANCGPGALAAVLGLTLADVRQHIHGFAERGYINPTMMWGALRSLGVRFEVVRRPQTWPDYGLARIQWEGPWTKAGVPARAAYRHTHWVAAQWSEEKREFGIYDINAAHVGWISVADWAGKLVPWLIAETQPKSDGRWHISHAVELFGVGGR